MEQSTLTSSRNYDVRVAKRIYLHLNGKTNERPKMIVINDRHVRDFTTLLNRVTSGIKAPIAVRNIYTPVGGSKVSTLQTIENGKHYVAGGTEQFKKLKYMVQNKPRPYIVNKVSQVSHIRPPIHTVSRFRNLPEKPLLIHVFRNGDLIFQGARVLLSKRIMASLENVLELITDKVELSLPAKKLCTLEGHVIHTVTDIKDGEKYVAIEGSRKFIKLPYSMISSTSKNTRHPRLLLKRLSYQAPTVISDPNSTFGGTLPAPSISEKPKQIKRLMPPKQHKGKNRPFAGRKDIEARNLALSDARADSAFGTCTSDEKSIAKSPMPSEHNDTLNETQHSDEIVTVSDQQTVQDDTENTVPLQTEETLITKHNELSSEDNVAELKDQMNEDIPEETVTEETSSQVPDATTTHTQIDPTIIELQSEANKQSVDLSIARIQETEIQTKPNTENETDDKLSTSTNQLHTDSSQLKEEQSHHELADSL